jgi:polar amino acid transport system ATP-binding protein
MTSDTTIGNDHIVHEVVAPHLGEPIVRALGIEKYFGRNHVLRGVDLEVRKGEAVMMIGRSGSGKTTFLRCVNFLEEPTVGSIEIEGVRVEADPLHARSRAHLEQIRQIRIRAGMVVRRQ